MFVLQIRECFLQKGLKPTVAALMRMGIPERSAYNFLNGKAKSIKAEHLYKLCFYLNCTPKELLRVNLPKEDVSLENHPLKDWTKKPTAFPLQEFRDLNPTQLEAAQVAIRNIIDGE